MGKIIDMFKKLWCNNIKTHLKKISAAIGTTTNSITTAVVGYYIAIAIATANIELLLLVMGILIPLQGLVNLLCYYIFGSVKNGNGYQIPENKYILELVKNDEQVRELVKAKYTDRLLNGNHVGNGG